MRRLELRLERLTEAIDTIEEVGAEYKIGYVEGVMKELEKLSEDLEMQLSELEIEINEGE